MAGARVLPDEQAVELQEGETLLDASLRAGIPHTHVCGGNACCSTCRVLILEGSECLAPRNERERAIAERLNFGPEIRLACQTTVSCDVTLRRLVLDPVDEALADQLRTRRYPKAVSQEAPVAIEIGQGDSPRSGGEGN